MEASISSFRGAAPRRSCNANRTRLGWAQASFGSSRVLWRGEMLAGGIGVACGGVGDEGQAFAKRNGIRIIDGSALVGLLVDMEVWQEQPLGTAAPTAAPMQDPACPRCHSTMVRRASRHGFFWGCSRFPSCRGTRALE